MAGAKNVVLRGKYMGCRIMIDGGEPFIIQSGNAVFGARGWRINKREIEDYELVTEEKVRSGTSAILRGAAGAALLGPVGLLAGVTGRKKGIFTVVVLWKDGERSLIEIDDKIYKALVSCMF